MTENEELLAEANKAARLLRIGAEMADVEETTEHVYRSSAAIIERLADIVARRDAALLAARADADALRAALEQVEESLNHPDLADADERCDEIAMTVAAALAATPEEKQ